MAICGHSEARRPPAGQRSIMGGPDEFLPIDPSTITDQALVAEFTDHQPRLMSRDVAILVQGIFWGRVGSAFPETIDHYACAKEIVGVVLLRQIRD
eukprot:11186700-Lingulodinium_polyedra.AAC.1